MRSLSLEEFAVVLAHLTHFPPEQFSAVLSRLRVDQWAFLDAASKHPLSIADDMAADSPATSKAFQKALEQTTKDLATRKPTVAQVEALAASRVEPPAAGFDAERTMDVQSLRLGAAPMPFQSGPPMALPRGESTPAPDRGETIGLEAQPGDALPFGAPDFTSWTVEAYATFTAERRWLDPESVRKRYGIRDGADEHGLIVHFNRRFASQPGLRERWTGLVQQRARELERGG